MKKSALLVIDVQNGMFEESNPIYEGEQLLSYLQDLINKARTANVPVFYVQHHDEEFIRGTFPWAIHPSIAPQEGETVIHKSTPDSFHETELDEKLRAEQIENLVIAGNQTEYCVDTTVRRAFSLGYHVTLVKDAHRTWDSNNLTAKQVIDHHNIVLGNAFATLKETEEIQFSNTSLADVTQTQNGYVARFECHLKHSVDIVWSSLTENDKLSQWFSELQVDDLREGGVIKFDM